MNYYYIKIFENSNQKKFDEQLKYCLDTKSIGINFQYPKSLLKKSLLKKSLLKKSLLKKENKKLNKKINKEEIKLVIEKYLKETHKLNDTQINNRVRTYDRFINEIKKGDILFLCKGNNQILYIANVVSDYYFDKDNIMCHRRKIDNIKEFKTKPTFQLLQTLYKI
jgi:hypothetical protein